MDVLERLLHRAGRLPLSRLLRVRSRGRKPGAAAVDLFKAGLDCRRRGGSGAGLSAHPPGGRVWYIAPERAPVASRRRRVASVRFSRLGCILGGRLLGRGRRGCSRPQVLQAGAETGRRRERGGREGGGRVRVRAGGVYSRQRDGRGRRLRLGRRRGGFSRFLLLRLLRFAAE